MFHFTLHNGLKCIALNGLKINLLNVRCKSCLNWEALLKIVMKNDAFTYFSAVFGESKKKKSSYGSHDGKFVPNQHNWYETLILTSYFFSLCACVVGEGRATGFLRVDVS